MGLRNLRAICPNCGGKIHTQAKGLGHFTWANSWFNVKTGSECQHCAHPLTGKVKGDGKAESAVNKDYGAGPTTRPGDFGAPKPRIWSNQTGYQN